MLPYDKSAGVVQRLVYKFSKLGIGVRFPAPAPTKIPSLALGFFVGMKFDGVIEHRSGLFAKRLRRNISLTRTELKDQSYVDLLA